MTEKRIAALLILLYALLAALYSLSSPLFEAPDEIEHYRYMRVIARAGTLPQPDYQPRGQGHQPPLYYALHAPLLALLDDTGFDAIDRRKNPFYGYEFAIPGGDNKNEYLHTRAEQFPFTVPVARTVHLLRLISIGMGIATLTTCYAIYRRLWDNPALRLLALGFACFLPQFVYLSGHLNNDNLLMLLATLLLWRLLVAHRQALSWRNAAIFGILFGAAALTKSSAAFLAIPVGVAALLNWRLWWRKLPVVVLMAALIGGWYYARNLLIYGDLTNLAAWQTTWAFDVVNHGGFDLSVATKNFPYVYFTFWARFGSGAVTLGDAYHMFDGLVLVVILGMGARFTMLFRKITSSNPHSQPFPRRQGKGDALFASEEGVHQQSYILVAFILAWLLAAFYLAGIAWSGNQGRYLLPGLAVWGAILAAGVSAYFPRRLQNWLTGIAVAAWGGLTLALFFAFFVPAYYLETPPRLFTIGFYQYGGVVERNQFVEWDYTQDIIAQPGDVVRVPIYWHVLQPTQADLRFYLHSIDSDLVRRDTVPGLGKLPSTEWQAGDRWAETYVVPIPADAERQRVYSLVAGVYHAETQERLEVTSDGTPVNAPIIGHIIVPGEIAANPPESVYRFGDGIGLAEPIIKQTENLLEICLDWIATGTGATDYNLFVHVLDANDEILTQFDGQPREVYPTSYWQTGEVIHQCAALDKTGLDGERLAFGLYRRSDFARLPITDAAGQKLADDRIVLSLHP